MINRDKIRVLHTEWSDGWGGQEIRIINEMKALREEGISVFLACRKSSIIHQKAIENKISVFILPFKGSVDIFTLIALIKIIKKHSINIVNTHSGKDTWVGGFAAKLAGVKFIRTRHLSNKINTSRFNFINELADFIITTGEIIKADMVLNNRIDAKKIQSIPTGVDSDLFDPQLYDRDKSRLKYQLGAEEIVIGIVAVLRSSKRHDNFLKIARQLKLEFPEKKLRFLIVGEGPMREQVEDLIDKLSLRKDVRMLGHIENIPELMSCLDLFLFTADRNEGVPQVLMQSLLMNVKTVSSNDGSTADLYNENNFLISDPSFEALYKNTKMLINDFNKTSFLGDSRDYIVDSFSQKVATKKTLNIYKKLIETDAQNI
jgi:glycosyltransferase involved in cell wall biosynthesis